MHLLTWVEGTCVMFTPMNDMLPEATGQSNILVQRSNITLLLEIQVNKILLQAYIIDT